jgi:hypothetical protein
MHLTRGFLLGGAVLTALAGALYLFPGAAARLGLDFQDVPGLVVEMQRDEADTAELLRLAEETMRRVAAREDAVGRVVEGRLTLWRAASRFRALDAASPPCDRRVLARNFPGIPEEERCCREVIAWVAVWEERHPGEQSGLARRLTAELEDTLRHGPLSLPDPTTKPPREVTPPASDRPAAKGSGGVPR